MTRAQKGQTDEWAIEVRGVRVNIEGMPVLRGVDLKIPKGEMVALIGPNGSGKTTLLRTLLGLQRVDEGEIRLMGRVLSAAPTCKIGYVPQRFPVESAFPVSVREFLAMGCDQTRHWFWKRTPKVDATIEHSILELGIQDLLNRPLARLSGGQLQKVLIAFSLMENPEILLLDEPTAGVDSAGEHTFYEIISEVHQRRPMTVVLVSHDLSMVCRHANHIVALNGVVCCEGTPEQVVNEEALRQAFGVHMAPYHHVH